MVTNMPSQKLFSASGPFTELRAESFAYGQAHPFTTISQAQKFGFSPQS